MQYVNGGTLALEILNHRQSSSQSPQLAQIVVQQQRPQQPEPEPYSERRIAWYALQLGEALGFMHERGVAHHDVKSANVLIDRLSGGKLILTDFGNAVDLQKYEEPNGFTEMYAAPELIRAHARGDYQGLGAEKLDAFGLGAMLFELVCGQPMRDLTTDDETIGEFMHRAGVDAALNLPCVRLPWLSPASASSGDTALVGYSDALRNLLKILLDPDPNTRWTPSGIEAALRNDVQSPLLTNFVVAAQTQVPGAQVSVDNVQLGMFVQRGQDWDGSNTDGGPGTVGVIVALDPDAGFATVEWPTATLHLSSQGPMCCRIGNNNKFELQIGPVGLPDFYSPNVVGGATNTNTNTNTTTKPRVTGIVSVPDVSFYKNGQMINAHCMVVGIRREQNLLLVAPTQNISIPTQPLTPPAPLPIEPMRPSGELHPTPDHWKLDAGLFVELNDLTEMSAMKERQDVFDLIFDAGGMDIQACEVVSIKRVQATELWQDYAATREGIAVEHWGMANERRLFHGTLDISPEDLLRDSPRDFYQHSSTLGDRDDVFGRQICFHATIMGAISYLNRTRSGEIQVVVSKVAVGRVMVGDPQQAPDHCNHHAEMVPMRRSNRHRSSSGTVENASLSIRNPTQAYPEYVVTYRDLASANSPPRRSVRATRPGGGTTNPSPRARLRLRQQHIRQQQLQYVSSLLPQFGLQHSGAASNPPPTPTAPTTISSQTAAASTATSVAAAAASGPSATKQCVVCLERPVSHVLVPCGHPCLCQICSTKQGLAKLGRKCPECRQAIQTTIVLYGRVVND
jgi:hypothetical protein